MTVQIRLRDFHTSRTCGKLPLIVLPNHLTDPLAQGLNNLQREFADLVDLRDNTLINRTIQLVKIILEDHGKVIRVFTIVTIVFFSLSFISSPFSTRIPNIGDMEHTQRLS
jgi:hypothetical protein